MNDEIKEILARLSRYVITPDVRHDFDDLLDYITNLQQELEEYKDTKTYSKRFLYKANKDRLNANLDLVKENERLKWDKEQLNSLVNSCQDEIRKLKEKIKHYEETVTFGDYVKEVNLLVDYKSRCEKAVKYIDQHKFNKFGDIDCGEAEAIIEILNGRRDE